MLTRHLIRIVAIGLSVWCGSAGAVVVASWEPANPIGLIGFGEFSGFGTAIAGQSFLTSSSGTLSEISVLLSKNDGTTPGAILVDLYSTSAGMPSNLLGTAAIGSPALPAYDSPASFTADFSPFGIVLAAGTTYAFLLRASDGNAAAYGSLFFPGEDYLDGMGLAGGPNPVLPAGLDALDGYDLSFSVSATPVPVPAAAWLLGSGLLGLAGVARRRLKTRTLAME